MRVIPVMDLMNGIVVHAKGGVRREYEPVKSVLTSSPDPMNVMYAFKCLGFTELYIADLDAIEGRAPNLGAIRSLVRRSSMRITADAGVRSVESVESLVRAGVSGVVVATETIPTPAFLSECTRLYGERIVGSLDLRGVSVVSRSREVASMTPLEAAAMFEDSGVSSLLVVDLSRVGMRSGPPITLLEKLASHLSIPVIAGGGVRSVEDLKALRSIGVKGALVATALHTGTIKPKDLQEFLNSALLT